jgi:hypothetical protein
MKRIAIGLLAAAVVVPGAGVAQTTPNACELVTLEEINQIAARPAVRVQQQQAGNPSQCGFLDSRRGAVVVVTLREVRYAVVHEMNIERDNLEKIYRARAKKVDAIGDEAYWLAANKQLGFRKGRYIVTATFSTPKNQNDVDTAQLARLIEARLP